MYKYNMYTYYIQIYFHFLVVLKIGLSISAFFDEQ